MELIAIFLFFIVFNVAIFSGFLLLLKKLRHGGPLFAVEDEEILALLRFAAKTNAASAAANVQPGSLETSTNALAVYRDIIKVAQAHAFVEVFEDHVLPNRFGRTASNSSAWRYDVNLQLAA